jgi:diadenosine tetraphosphate (Ap4A) HIT family hydrolase
MIIFESENYIVEAVDQPLVDRADGGHVAINPKFTVSTRQGLTPRQAIELMRLSIVAGEAMTKTMIAQGIEVGRINYQDNGNWSVFKPGGPQLHLHIYGRARNARIQKYGQACYFPHRDENPEFYQNNRPLLPEDVRLMKEKMDRLMAEEKFSDDNWRL